ncbi:DUF3489 domain-containing protein [Croceicoccus naphthovorans]|uniref:DUF3489 domain-containing protein n=1 Tax=Croceicoccus naphthovorans TaxID=1348774 RepID=UPI0009E29BCE
MSSHHLRRTTIVQTATNLSKDSKPRRPRRMARAPKPRDGGEEAAASEAAAPATVKALTKRMTKAELLLGLLRRREGATLEQLVGATGWLPHTTRVSQLRRCSRFLQRISSRRSCRSEWHA